MLQGLPFQQFHGNETLALVIADLVDSTDIRMVQGGGSAGLAAKTLEGLRVAGHLLRQKLEGDKTAQVGVFGLVNDAHAAAPEFLENAVVRDALVDHYLR